MLCSGGKFRSPQRLRRRVQQRSRGQRAFRPGWCPRESTSYSSLRPGENVGTPRADHRQTHHGFHQCESAFAASISLFALQADIKQLWCPDPATQTRFLCSESRYISKRGLLSNRHFLSLAYPTNCLMAELARVLQMQLRFDARTIGINGTDSKMTLIADLACAASTSDELEDLEFSVR